jgi:hypothetical protein
MSLSEDLCVATLEDVVARTGLTEHLGDDGGPALLLFSSFGPEPVGRMRLFTGDGVVAKAVYVALAVPQIELDSHMTFAFSRADSAIPHFTLDSVFGQGSYAFHLDLIPRAELGTHVDYMDATYDALTPTFNEVRDWEGLSRTNLSPRQIAMMSPWMLVNRATEAAFAQMPGPVGRYRDHWYALVEKGLPEAVLAGLSDVDLAARDAEHRRQLFSPEVDPVWNQVERLVGGEVMERIRRQLLTNEIGEV